MAGNNLKDRHDQLQRGLPGNIFVFHLKLNLLLVAVTAACFVTRLWRLQEPHGVVFDEIHFGRFASYYLKGVFFFDVHPPLGKLLIALMGYMGGYDGSFDFSNIGAEYPCKFPLGSLRLLPAVCGSLLCPLSYLVLSELGFHQYSAVLAAFLVLTDNSLLVQSRFILIDTLLLFSLLSMVLSLLKFIKHHNRPLSTQGCLWGMLLSLSITTSISIKYSGLFTLLVVYSVLLYYMWRIIIDRTKTLKQVAGCLSLYLIYFVVLPVFLYCSMFYLHLGLLTKSGPHDEMMSSAFQANLEGGLAKITQGQPREVVYGSQITLRSTHGTPCWLHSHEEPYPVRYSDNRGSSAQQQVTCYTFKDINNWWIVTEEDTEVIEPQSSSKPVKNGDIIQLVHGVTGRSLNSHDVAAPMSPQCMEVSCYIDYNISWPRQTLWRVELINGATTNDSWHAIDSQLRLIHVSTSQALKFTGQQLPDWGFYQLEVATDRVHQQDTTVWNVEEHRLTTVDGASHQHSVPPDIWNPRKVGFWEKFIEIQFKMLSANQDVTQEHQYSSSPLEWPTMYRGVAYWVSADSNAQIHFLGNLVTWISGLFALVILFIIFIVFALRWRRGCHDLLPDEWQRLILSVVLLAGVWVINLVPYFLMERTLFLHHYLPALVHLILVIPVTLELIYTYILRSSIQRQVASSLLFVWITAVFLAFVRISPLSYGHTDLTAEDIKALQWRESWGLIYQDEFT